MSFEILDKMTHIPSTVWSAFLLLICIVKMLLQAIEMFHFSGPLEHAHQGRSSFNLIDVINDDNEVRRFMQI